MHENPSINKIIVIIEATRLQDSWSDMKHVSSKFVIKWEEAAPRTLCPGDAPPPLL